MQIPMDALRTADMLAGRTAMWAVREEAELAIVAETVGSGCGSSNSAVMGSGTQAWGGNGQITGVAGGWQHSATMGSGVNRVGRTGTIVGGSRERGRCCIVDLGRGSIDRARGRAEGTAHGGTGGIG